MDASGASHRIVIRLLNLIHNMVKETYDRDTPLSPERLESFRLALAAGEPVPRRYDRYISREDRELRQLARNAHELGVGFLVEAHRGISSEGVEEYLGIIDGMREAARKLRET